MPNNLKQNYQYRRRVMRVLLFFVVVAGFIFSAVNFYRGLIPLAIMELTYALFSLFLWQIILVTARFQMWITLFLVPFFIILVYAMYVPNSSESIFVWILTVPVISYLLMGRRQGFWLSLFFISCGVTVYHFRFIGGDLAINIADSVNIIASACLMISLAHVHEINREKNEERLLELAGTDKLTGLANRMKLMDTFKTYAEYAKRHESPLSVVLFDLDFFKNINDKHGHHVGDVTLRNIAHFIEGKIRKTDLLARFGGEEFALLIAGSSEENCFQRVNLVRQQLSETVFSYEEKPLAMTVSAGISTFGSDGTSLDDLLMKADQRLYLAKDNGRNCVVDANNEQSINLELKNL